MFLFTCRVTCQIHTNKSGNNFCVKKKKVSFVFVFFLTLNANRLFNVHFICFILLFELEESHPSYSFMDDAVPRLYDIFTHLLLVNSEMALYFPVG